MNRRYPQLEIDLSALRSNAQHIVRRCHDRHIRVCGVVKGADGLPEVARTLRQCGADELGTSRLEQVEKCRAAGIGGPWLLIRIPGLTELPDVVRLCETSLQSERVTLDALEEECVLQGKTHRVIVMADLGDLREGFWDKDEMVDVCVHVERELPHVVLAGIGVNLTCYGSTKPTPEKMQELLAIADRIERRIGRKLEIVSGGATSSYTLVHWDTMPEQPNIVLAHGGANRMHEEVLGKLCGKPVYFDISFILSYIQPELLLQIIRKHGADRILFATDFPWSDPAADLTAVQNLPLTDAEKEQILWKNAQTLLHLPQI